MLIVIRTMHFSMIITKRYCVIQNFKEIDQHKIWNIGLKCMHDLDIGLPDLFVIENVYYDQSNISIGSGCILDRWGAQGVYCVWKISKCRVDLAYYMAYPIHYIEKKMTFFKIFKVT